MISEKVTIQNNNSCVRNKDLLNIRLNGIYCEFLSPQYIISGATQIQPINIGDEGVYLVNDINNVDLSFIFSTDLSSLSVLDIELGFNIYGFDFETNCFNSTPILTESPTPISGASNCPQIIDDWYLPSLDEVAELYDNLHLNGIGGLTGKTYWSSTEFDLSFAYHYDFNAGTGALSQKKSLPANVRAIRNFNDTANKYNLGDLGPANGYIFYTQIINSTTQKYYEAAPADIGNIAWSNVDSALIGDTLSGIGEGYDNTLKIVNQSGHLISAALNCLDYLVIFSGDCINYTINVDSLPPDNEYLIKPYFIFNSCNFYSNILGTRYNTFILDGEEYCIYNSDSDYYLSVSTSAATPEFATTNISENPLGQLIGYSYFPDKGDVTFLLKPYRGEVIVSLNGLTLSNNSDYTISGNTLTLLGPTVDTDVLTIIHVLESTTNNGLVNDNINVVSIPSGTIGNQGNNPIYYNTTTNKYELYTTSNIIADSDVIITLNGVVLAPNIDYYLSISNPKRIILEGIIEVGDLINIYYNSVTSLVGEVFINNPTITWSVTPTPQLNNGVFTLELAEDGDFNTIVFSSQTEYIAGVNLYSDQLVISGNVGDTYYYRVKNEKNYQPITGNTLDTIAYSEVIPIIIATNSINSY